MRMPPSPTRRPRTARRGGPHAAHDESRRRRAHPCRGARAAGGCAARSGAERGRGAARARAECVWRRGRVGGCWGGPRRAARTAGVRAAAHRPRAAVRVPRAPHGETTGAVGHVAARGGGAPRGSGGCVGAAGERGDADLQGLTAGVRMHCRLVVAQPQVPSTRSSRHPARSYGPPCACPPTRRAFPVPVASRAALARVVRAFAERVESALAAPTDSVPLGLEAGALTRSCSCLRVCLRGGPTPRTRICGARCCCRVCIRVRAAARGTARGGRGACGEEYLGAMERAGRRRGGSSREVVAEVKRRLSVLVCSTDVCVTPEEILDALAEGTLAPAIDAVADIFPESGARRNTGRAARGSFHTEPCSPASAPPACFRSPAHKRPAAHDARGFSAYARSSRDYYRPSRRTAARRKSSTFGRYGMSWR
ncbi:hypothetical protein B0H14DRAFT_312910 [Mycena olivaceomarginata]|nr:hypothetical protein B0H14DRAFT_312910 [Mycena olivaceomarginata]